MNIKFSFFLSIAISTFALATCLIFGPILFTEIQTAIEEIDVEMKEFRRESDVLWKEMQRLKNGARSPRQAAAWPICRKNSKNLTKVLIRPPKPRLGLCSGLRIEFKV